MTLDPSVEDALRAWVGSIPDSTSLETVYDLLGDVHTTALSILRRRRADLVANPTRFTLADGYTEDVTGQIAALDKAIAQLVQLVPDNSGKVTMVGLRRPDPSRGLPGEYGFPGGFPGVWNGTGSL